MPLRHVFATTAMLCLTCGIARAQTVTSLINQPPPDGVIYGFLMTDGTILYQGGNVSDWYKLTPDAYGSYQNGTWSSVASTPAGYAPYATGGAVLPDGRLLITGGEYLLNAAGTNLDFRLTTNSAVYDPRSGSWTVFKGPKDWIAIGDSPGTVVANGRFLIGEKITRAMAMLNTTTLTWKPFEAPGKNDIHAEEGWTLLPDGTVLTADVTAATHSERYFPGTDGSVGAWHGAGSTVANLKFTWTGAGAKPLRYDGNHFYKPAGEIGPAILRPDGTVFATGALNLHATAGHTAIYHPGPRRLDAGLWLTGPDFQPGDDAGDEYAVLLPNGNVLVEANTNGQDVDHDVHARARRIAQLIQTRHSPAASLRLHAARNALAQAPSNPCAPNPLQTYHLYEFDGANFTLQPVDVTSCGNSLALLVLPTGETIVGGVGLYTSATGNPAPDWAPEITRSPRVIAPGGVYRVEGRQFTGLSQAAAYGDEFPTPTNYPLLRITNAATGHVVYARTHDWSDSGVATGRKIVSTLFDVPDVIEPGDSIIEVVANGIPSRAVNVRVE